MRNKWFVTFLVTSVILSSVSPTIVNAESVDDNIQILSESENVTNEQQPEEDSDIESISPSFSIESIESVDLPNTQVSIEEQAAIQEMADDTEEGWTTLTAEKNIQFKYIGDTLYLKLVDEEKPTAMPTYGKYQYPNYSITDEFVEKAQNVTTVIIGKGITTVANKAFACNTTHVFEKLQTVILPEEVTEIGNGAFSNAKNLKNISLAHIEKIGNVAFSGTALSKVEFNFVNMQLGRNTFSDCPNLKEVCYKGTSAEWANVLTQCADDDTDVPNLMSVKLVHCRGDEEPVLATCTEPSEKVSICGVCGKAYKDENGTEYPALGHDYSEYTVDVAPTCTEKGSQSRKCMREGCDATETQELAALGHEYAPEYTVDVAPTCTTAGSQSKHCTRCGEADPDSVQEIPALGHEYVTKVTKEATCTEDGVQTDTCTRCGDVKTQAIKATGHQWSDWTKTADATVNGAEQQQRTCATCGTVETKAVGEKLAPTATVNTSTVTLKVKQSTKGLTVTGLAKGDSVAAWKSTDTRVFTVKGNADGTCTLTGKKKGSAKLEITLASGLTKTVTVKVQTAAVKTSKVTVAEKKLTVKKGEKASLKATVAPFTSAQKLTYTSSNKKVATVSKNGVVTAKQAGTAKITVKSGSKKVTVTITVPKTKTTAITVAKDITVKKGKTYSLKAKVAPKNSDEKITYTSSNKKIATVTKSGKVKGVKKGTATITVKSGSETVKVNVTVK